MRTWARSAMTKTGVTKTTKSEVLVRAGVQVRWESAAPILATVSDAGMRTTVAKWSGEYYVVSVGGLEPPRGFGGMDAANDLKENSSLDLGLKALLSNRVQMVGSEAGPVYLLRFPKVARIDDLTKSIVVEVRVGETRIRATFGVKGMVFQGKATL